MEKLDFETFRPKFGLWAEKFRPFIESKGMWDIMQKVKRDAARFGVAPDHKNTFRAFETTDPDSVKVIFVLMDPYPRRYKDGTLQATGIAMDCSNSPDGKIQPSLKYFYDAMEKELGKKIERSPSLQYLHEQGVMMYNSDLTCKLNRTESHSGLWVEFQKYFLEEVMYSTTGIIYVLCGDASEKLKRYINPLGNYIFKLSHPSSAQYGAGEWDSKGIFNRINTILKDNNNDKVFWDKAEWIEYKTPPF